MTKNIEGSFYKSFLIEGIEFSVYYGYNSEAERTLWDPTPIFPNFIKSPIFTEKGLPLARADQDICEHYDPRDNISGEEWCNDCLHFKLYDEVIGICRCEKRRQRQNE